MQLNLNREELEFLEELLTTGKEVSFIPQRKKLYDILIKRIERTKKPIKPRSAKNKGMEWQKEICGVISDITGIEYDQQNDNCLIHSRESGLSGTDVILRGEAKEKFPHSIECKNCKSLSIPDWIRQAASNSINNDWILFIKSTAIETKKIVVLPIESFISLYQKILK